MKTRSQRIVQAKLRHSRLSNIIDFYYVKTIDYGIYTHITDYKKVRCRFKQNRRTYTTKKDARKQASSIKRAKDRVYQIVEANRKAFKKRGRKNVFFTLTTKDQLKDYKESNKKIKAFIRRLNKYCGYPIKYIIVPELHESGAIHYHGVFFNLPYIPVKTLRYNIWKYGYVDIQLPKGIKSISRYLTKYLTKDFQENTPVNTKLYFCSRGLSYPQTRFSDQVPRGKITEDGVLITPNYLAYTIIKKNEKNK